MKEKKYIKQLHKSLRKEDVGNKAHSLLFLKKNKCNVPLTYVLIAEAFSDFQQNKQKVTAQLLAELRMLPDMYFAVRSSTNIEDACDFSHAGQFETLLNVKGTEAVFEAVTKVWVSSLKTEENEYKAKAGNCDEMKCAVILQEMIPAKLAGVGFSKNPVNNSNEVIIEAVEGSGEKLVQKGENPRRWIFKNGKLKEGPPCFSQESAVTEVFHILSGLHKKYRKHIDVEWVSDGNTLYFLQLRAITSHTEQMVYSSKMAQEMLPGQIKPLVWSVNIPLVNGTWLDILTRVTKKTDLQPYDLAKSFYYRCYFNVTNLGKIFREFGVPFERLEEIMLSDEKTKHAFRPGLKTIRHTLRILKFIHSVLHFEKFLVSEYALLKQQVGELNRIIESDFHPDNFSELYLRLSAETKRLTYLNIFTPILMRIANKRLSVKLKKQAINYNQIDFNAAFPELKELSPVFALYQIKQLLDQLPEINNLPVLTGTQLAGLDTDGKVQNEIENFIQRFGHFSESGNDFSYPKWEEDINVVLKMAMDSEPLKKETMLDFYQIRFSSLQRKRIEKAFRKAGRFKVYREQISSLYIFGFGLFRKLFLKLADEWVKAGFIQNREDIFYLYKEEIDTVLVSGKVGFNYDIQSLVLQRKEEMLASQNLVLPPVIYGDVAPVVEFGKIKNLKGVATSAGSFKGTLRVVKNSSDFNKVKRGDVVAIPFSDVSWTPVLVKAGAIVSESGGMLSHCSIIAREMGIPALVSVDNVCALADDLEVTVNASNGVLTIHDYE